MTKKQLYQLHDLNKEVEDWQAQLRLITPLKSPCLASNGGGSSEPSDNVAKVAEQRERIMRIIDGKLAEIQQIRGEILSFISDIPDSLTRRIFLYRCVSGMSWNKVADEIGGNNTEDSVKKIFYRYCRKNGIW